MKEKESEIGVLKEQVAALRAKLSKQTDLNRLLEEKQTELFSANQDKLNLSGKLEKELQEKTAIKANYDNLKAKYDLLVDNEKGHLQEQKKYSEEKK